MGGAPAISDKENMVVELVLAVMPFLGELPFSAQASVMEQWRQTLAKYEVTRTPDPSAPSPESAT